MVKIGSIGLAIGIVLNLFDILVISDTYQSGALSEIVFYGLYIPSAIAILYGVFANRNAE